MTTVALGALLITLATTIGFVHVIRTLVRQHARERNLILNQLLHATGNTWQPPPSDTSWLEAARSSTDELPDWTATPEQDEIY